MLGMLMEMLDKSRDSSMVIIDRQIDGWQCGRSQLDVFEVNRVLPDPLGPASRLALVDGDAEVNVSRLVVSFLTSESCSGLR